MGFLSRECQRNLTRVGLQSTWDHSSSSAKLIMIICPRCTYKNNDTNVLCLRCHFVLNRNQGAKTTTNIELEHVAAADVANGQLLLPAPDVMSDVHNTLLIVKFGTEFRKSVLLGEDDKVVLGRVKQVSQNVKAVNLSDIGAWELGVSRIHAMLTQTQTNLFVTDLGTVNGTWVDDKRIPAYSPVHLEDGLVIRLAALRIFISFVESVENVTDSMQTPRLFVLLDA